MSAPARGLHGFVFHGSMRNDSETGNGHRSRELELEGKRYSRTTVHFHGIHPQRKREKRRIAFRIKRRIARNGKLRRSEPRAEYHPVPFFLENGGHERRKRRTVARRSRIRLRDRSRCGRNGRGTDTNQGKLRSRCKIVHRTRRKSQKFRAVYGIFIGKLRLRYGNAGKRRTRNNRSERNHRTRVELFRRTFGGRNTFLPRAERSIFVRLPRQ